jgi:hypothetical protein
MVVITYRRAESEDGEWVLYEAYIMALYDDGNEHIQVAPIHVPRMIEDRASYSVHNDICRRVAHDEIFKD